MKRAAAISLIAFDEPCGAAESMTMSSQMCSNSVTLHTADTRTTATTVSGGASVNYLNFTVGESMTIGEECGIPYRPVSLPLTVPWEASMESSAPRRGKLYLGGAQAVFAIGSGENSMYNISAVLSCLPQVNEDINEMVRGAGIAVHKYFLLDDHDALERHQQMQQQAGSGGGGTADSRSGSPPVGSADASPLCGSQSTNGDSSRSSKSPYFRTFDDIYSRFHPQGEELHDALQFIHQQRVQGHNILVHCDGGVLRSAATVISYLMRYGGKSLKEAKRIVAACRPEIRVRPLEECLSVIEKSCSRCSGEDSASSYSNPEQRHDMLARDACCVSFDVPKTSSPSHLLHHTGDEFTANDLRMAETSPRRRPPSFSPDSRERSFGGMPMSPEGQSHLVPPMPLWGVPTVGKATTPLSRNDESQSSTKPNLSIVIAEEEVCPHTPDSTCGSRGRASAAHGARPF